MALDSFINTFAPARIDMADTNLTSTDKSFINFAERLLEEGQAYRNQLGLDKQIARAWEMVEGKHFTPKKHKEHRARVAANLVQAYLERKASMLTDAMPELNVRSRTGNESTATVLQQGLQGVWTEKSVQDLLLRAIVSAAVTGQVAVGCDWDPFLDFGNGDIALTMFQSGECIIDPYLRSVADLQDKAEYVITKEIVPLAKIREMFPERGYLVKAQSEYSQYQSHRGNEQSAYTYHRPGRHHSTKTESVVPRTCLYRLYFRDRMHHPLKPTNEEGLTNYLFPRKRVMMWAGNVPLYDGNGKYWDGLYPVEMMDWGIEPRHQYGASEIKSQTSLQLAFDVLLSGVVDNARLINDPPWLIDEDAVTPEVLQQIARYGDRMGWPIVKKPRMQVDRNPPGQLSNITFSTLQMIQQLLEVVTGVVDVVQGRMPGQDTSGIAIQNLQIASQSTIRRQARQVENFLQRSGRLMLSRIIQFYTDERLFHATDEWGKTGEFVWRRAEFIRELAKMADIDMNKGVSAEEETERTGKLDRALQNAFKDVTLMVTPMSGLPESHGAKTNIATSFAKEGWISPYEALRAARFSEPKEMLKRGDEWKVEQAKLQAQVAMALQGQGQMPGGSGGGRQVPITQRGEQIPTIQRSAPGGQAPPSETGE